MIPALPSGGRGKAVDQLSILDWLIYSYFFVLGG
jgi:hypothetical protein